MTSGRTLLAFVSAALFLVSTAQTPAQQPPPLDPTALASFRWRELGPNATSLTSLTTDSAFPYRVCALDAAGLTRCTVVHHDSTSTPGWETLPLVGEGPVVADPTEGDVLYTSLLRRFDRRTGQGSWIGPELAEQFRGRTFRAAVAFSSDGRTLFAGRRIIWRSTNSGQTWTAISPDLLGADEGSDPPAQITAMATSPIDNRVLWAGTSRGTLHMTRDNGATWTTVTPPISASGSSIADIEASRFDPQSVYVTTTGDASGAGPTVWRTRSLGATWTNIGLSLPPTTALRSVREDPQRRGLLFAAAGTAVFVSIDDGERWQSIKNNLPDVVVADVVIRDSDLVVATLGRGAWVLDDFSPLRQMTPDVLRADSFIFRPPQTWRVRASAAGTSASNGEGVAISYLAKPTPGSSIWIDIIETATGETIRRFSSIAADSQPGDAPLTIAPGLQRVVWDLRYARPEADPSAPGGARVLPGTYQVRLSTSAQSVRQSVAVRLDPRVRVLPADLSAQRTLARTLDGRRTEIARALASPGAARNTTALSASLDELRRLTRAVNDADVRPSAALEAAAADALTRAKTALDGPT